METLISELKTELAERKADYDRLKEDGTSSFYSRDRYGHYYPDYESMRWHSKHTTDVENRLEAMKAKTFGPTHTIGFLENGDYDHCSIELFEYQG